jgi:hypothetical protein
MRKQDELNLGVPTVEELKLVKVEADQYIVDEANSYMVVLRDGLRGMKITVCINLSLALHNGY